MRFLVSMKMSSAAGRATHQLTLEHPSNSIEDLCAIMNRQEFLIFQLFYKREQNSGEIWWQDRGKILINTSCIGKVQEFIDMEAEENHDDPNRNVTFTMKPTTGYKNPRFK